MSLVVPPNFKHNLCVLNTNIEGKVSVMFALTSIKGQRLVQSYVAITGKVAIYFLNNMEGDSYLEELSQRGICWGHPLYEPKTDKVSER